MALRVDSDAASTRYSRADCLVSQAEPSRRFALDIRSGSKLRGGSPLHETLFVGKAACQLADCGECLGDVPAAPHDSCGSSSESIVMSPCSAAAQTISRAAATAAGM